MRFPNFGTLYGLLPILTFHPAYTHDKLNDTKIIYNSENVSQPKQIFAVYVKIEKPETFFDVTFAINSKHPYLPLFLDMQNAKL